MKVDDVIIRFCQAARTLHDMLHLTPAASDCLARDYKVKSRTEDRFGTEYGACTTNLIIDL